MTRSEQTEDSNTQVVKISARGQATIPKEFREKLGLNAPGRVVFRETEGGDVTIERVERPSERRGVIDSDGSATQRLREKRAQDRADLTQRFEDTSVEDDGDRQNPAE